MKLKRIFPFLVAILALMTSCDDEETMTLLDEIQVSSSYVSIPVDGGSTPITLTANDSWTVENNVEWLTISSTSGSAGESTLTFSAESALDGRTAEVLIQCAGKTQRINVIQGLATISTATCQEVIDGPDSKTYRVTGVCTAITNTTYGNWYLEDETGSIYIYGTVDDKGQYNFLDLGLEVGDEVTVQGPKTTYYGTVELVDVTIVNINKSLVKVDSVQNAQLPIEGGEFTAYLTCKGQGVSVDIPDDAKSWLSISSIESAGEEVVVKFNAAANTGGDRGTTLTFRTTDGEKEYSTETTISQKGAIIEATIEEFLAAEVGGTKYRLAGVITDISNTTYGNLDIRDFSGETFVYGIEDFQDKDLKVGDIITIVGERSAYNGSPQVGDAVLESVIPVAEATIAEVLTKPDSNDDYFMVTGEITNIDNPTYGNLYLKDGDSEIYLYGCYPGYGATGDYRKYLIEDKGIKVGDILTVIATKGSYNGVPQLAHGIYFSHESAE
ncbi:Putative binding domain-containing protein, N-terminal [Tangfeifania diversioriginum]|uniref:Putative binding domain-containing protein, N-terminal n=1 Tax=Tangfeifania diversioriginum TaxID=1168035 RepID=A0A1M6I9T5_9BACT|nr:BACON domain-containing carbohydrate-binding protein [Tangfeifania diversioriginum]SHJ31254.1 Putative binding domain-containing protein, N-terminal [Tangfeifania diversioriginum]